MTLALRLPCLCPQVVTPLVWNKPDIENSIPLWIIILAILAGLLLLALLIYVLYKVSETQMLIWGKISPLIETCFYFSLVCSLDSSSDLYPTTWPWRKHKSSPSPKPRREAAMTVWAKRRQRRRVMEAEEQIWKQRPLELHCAALDEDKHPEISELNECFFFPFVFVFF